MESYYRRTFAATNHTVYFEFHGDAIMRQIEVHPDIVLLLQGEEVGCGALNEFQFTTDEGATAIEFDQVWKQWSNRPHGTRRVDSPIVKEFLRQAKFSS